MKGLSGLDEFILFTIGDVDLTNSLGVVLWARRPPGPGFILHIMLSELCTGKKPIILVDDLLPSALFNRDVQEQNKINKTYIDFMGKEGCKIILSSQLFSSSVYFYQVVRILHRISYREFLRCLPEQKRIPEQFVELKISEALHIGAELMLFEAIRKMNVGTIIIPEFAQAVVAFHRNISVNPLSIIVTPTFSPETLEEKVSSMKALLDESSRHTE